MEILFISDNSYFCMGIEPSGMSSHHIEPKGNLHGIIQQHNQYAFFVIAVKNQQIRSYIIKDALRKKLKCIVMVDDIVKEHHFKLGGIIYASSNYNLDKLKRLFVCYAANKQIQLTLREQYVFNFSHLSNNHIADALRISVKNVSGYRQSIVNKMMLKNRNGLITFRKQPYFNR